MDKLMHKIGLHGKSFIPLIMGFGCNVPAIMATGTLESKNDRLLTMLIIPFMSCNARLPVYVLFISAFFADYSGTMLFLIYIIGVVIAVISAMFIKKIILKKDDIPFVMELPPYRIPHLHTSIKHMWEKGREYLKKIGGIILIASIIIWALGKFPLNIEYSRDYESNIAEIKMQYEQKRKSAPDDNAKKIISDEKEIKINEIKLIKESERMERSYIGRIGHMIEPLINPLGFDWKMGVSIFAGLAAKEVVVSTLGVLYSGRDSSPGDKRFINMIKNQKYISGNREGEKVFSPLVALGFIIFILIYFPCIAVIAAIKRESGSWKWALFSAGYTTALAWVISFLIYQIGSMVIG